MELGILWSYPATVIGAHFIIISSALLSTAHPNAYSLHSPDMWSSSKPNCNHFERSLSAAVLSIRYQSHAREWRSQRWKHLLCGNSNSHHGSALTLLTTDKIWHSPQPNMIRRNRMQWMPHTETPKRRLRFSSFSFISNASSTFCPSL